MSKKKAIAFGVKTAQNPSLLAGLIGTFLEIIIGVSILMLILSPLFIWMYGFEAIWGYAIIIAVLAIILLFVFYEPSNTSNRKGSSSKYKINKNKSEKIKKEYSKEKTCPNCGKTINAKAVRCKYCNYYFKSKSTYKRCPECNSLVNMQGNGVCRYCGFDLIKQEFPTKEKKKTKMERLHEKIDSQPNIKEQYNEKMACPICGKTINRRSIRCKYCKTMLKEY